jgi:hypothetical protein
MYDIFRLGVSRTVYLSNNVFLIMTKNGDNPFPMAFSSRISIIIVQIKIMDCKDSNSRWWRLGTVSVVKPDDEAMCVLDHCHRMS